MSLLVRLQAKSPTSAVSAQVRPKLGHPKVRPTPFGQPLPCSSSLGAKARGPLPCASSLEDNKRDHQTDSTGENNDYTGNSNTARKTENEVPDWAAVIVGRLIQSFWLYLAANVLGEVTDPGGDIWRSFQPSPDALMTSLTYSLPALSILGIVCLTPSGPRREEQESVFQKEALGLIGNTVQLRIDSRRAKRSSPKLSQKLTPEVVLSASRTLKEYWTRPWKEERSSVSLDLVSRGLVAFSNELLVRGVLFQAIYTYVHKAFAESDPTTSLMFYERVFAAYAGVPNSALSWWSSSVFLAPLALTRVVIQGEAVRKFVRASVNYPIRAELLRVTAAGETLAKAKGGSKAASYKSLFSGPSGELAFKKLKQRQRTSPQAKLAASTSSAAASEGGPTNGATAPVAFTEVTAALAAGAVSESVEFAKSAAASSAIMAVTAEATYNAVVAHMESSMSSGSSSGNGGSMDIMDSSSGSSGSMDSMDSSSSGNPSSSGSLDSRKVFRELAVLTSVETMEDGIAFGVYGAYTVLGFVAINASFLTTHNLASSFFAVLVLSVMPAMLRRLNDEDGEPVPS